MENTRNIENNLAFEKQRSQDDLGKEISEKSALEDKIMETKNRVVDLEEALASSQAKFQLDLDNLSQDNAQKCAEVFAERDALSSKITHLESGMLVSSDV